MAVAVVIETESEVPALLGWAWQVARARRADVKVLFAGGRDATGDDPAAVAVKAAVSDIVDTHARLSAMQAEAAQSSAGAKPGKAGDPERCPQFELVVLKQADAAGAVLEAIKAHGIKLLIVAKHRVDRSKDALPAVLFREARCMVLLLRPGNTDGQRCRRILVPTAGGPHASEALKLADVLASLPDASCSIDQQQPGGVDALYVEPNVGPEAEAVGAKLADKAIRKALGDPAGHPLVSAKVRIARDFREGTAQAAEQGAYDLVLIGATNHWHARRALFGSVPDKLLSDAASGLTVGVVRQAVPFVDAATEAVRLLLERIVPQLEREDRISLVERVQGASKWNFDFVALICLSTLIATLGLMQNSVAVVIGAMLVAPLMTPLVGCGLSVVQGNGRLIREAIHAVLLGFVLAFSIAVAMGYLIPHAGVTTQMLARGQPNMLDLGVAFVSGMAAAYATARPNLSGALPGVAIAAALVPPISTSGVALAHGDYITSAGASLLFVTNIVAIVLGAAISLYAVGMQPAHLHTSKKRWTRHAAMSLIMLVVLLSVPLGYWLYDSLPRYRVTPELEAQIAQRVERQPDTSFERIETQGVMDEELQVELVIQSPTASGQVLVDDLDAIAEEFFGRPCRVRVVTHLVTESRE
ncbi:MAG: TIGR00341 family protein [Phycisphaerales bacterium JB063]